MTPEPVAGADALTEAEQNDVFRALAGTPLPAGFTQRVLTAAGGIKAAAVADLRAELDKARAKVAAVERVLEAERDNVDMSSTSLWVAINQALRLDAPAAAQPERWTAFPGKVPVCRDCGADWKPVQRGECSRCGSDAGPSPAAQPERDGGCVPCRVCGGSQTRGWHRHATYSTGDPDVIEQVREAGEQP